MKIFKRSTIFIFFFLYTVVHCIAQDSATFSKIKYYSEKVKKYLDKERELSDQYAITINGISIYESLKDKSKENCAFFVSWDKIDAFSSDIKKYNVQQMIERFKVGSYEANGLQQSSINKTIPTVKNESRPLNGLKIAIDPGHIAGDMGMGDIERKYLSFKFNNSSGASDSIAIAEGILTFATATLLKNKLEAEGAEVFMTRKFNNSSAFGLTFQDWKNTCYDSTVDSLYYAGKLTRKEKDVMCSADANDRDKFREIFKDIELLKRAEIINNYQPDFTVIIHYNVDETNLEWLKPSHRNFNMTFVGGAFMKSDLSSPEKRIEFLRLLASDDLEKSIALSASVVKSFEENLKVKTAQLKDASYLSKGCLGTEQSGVYCRNLALNRLVHSPLVYGETLYQDNMDECVLLNKECDKTKNARVQQVAEAYFQGILNYVKAK